MNSILMIIGAAVFALLSTLGGTLISVNRAATAQLSRLTSTAALATASVRLAEAIDVPQDAALGGTKVEWATDVTPWLTCADKPSTSGTVSFCDLDAIQFAGVLHANAISVCPVAAVRESLSSALTGTQVGAFYKAATLTALDPKRPVAFIVETNTEKLKVGSTMQAFAVHATCEVLAATALADPATEVSSTVVASLRATGIRGWKVLTVGDVLQQKGARHMQAAVASEALLNAVTGAKLGDMRLVVGTGRLMRFDGAGWFPTFAPAPIALPTYDTQTWKGNNYYAGIAPSQADDIYLPIPGTTLPDGTIVAPFKVGVYEARYLHDANSVGFLGHSGYSGYAAFNQPEPPVATGYTWQQAKSACEAVGARLPTLPQWLVLAQRAAQHGDNWSEGTAGSGFMRSGVNSSGSATAPLVASRDFADSHFGSSSTDFASKRTFKIYGASDGGGLYNGSYSSTSGVPATLWDLAGSAAEWVDWTPAVGTLPTGDTAKDFCAWDEKCGSALLDSIVPLNQKPTFTGVPGGWLKSTAALGNLATNNVLGVDGCTGACAKVAAVAMGGSAQSNAGGVFTFDTRWGRSYASPFIGFRCVRQVECSDTYSCLPTTASP